MHRGIHLTYWLIHVICDSGTLWNMLQFMFMLCIQHCKLLKTNINGEINIIFWNVKGWICKAWYKYRVLFFFTGQHYFFENVVYYQNGPNLLQYERLFTLIILLLVIQVQNVSGFVVTSNSIDKALYFGENIA